MLSRLLSCDRRHRFTFYVYVVADDLSDDRDHCNGVHHQQSEHFISIVCIGSHVFLSTHVVSVCVVFSIRLFVHNYY